MAEIGDDHKAASGNAEHFGEQSAGVADLLQGVERRLQGHGAGGKRQAERHAQMACRRQLYMLYQ